MRYRTPRLWLTAGTVESPVQAGEATSLADVCPSADIRARCSDGFARKHGYLLGIPLLGSQSRLKGTASELNRKQTSPRVSSRSFLPFPPWKQSSVSGERKRLGHGAPVTC